MYGHHPKRFGLVEEDRDGARHERIPTLLGRPMRVQLGTLWERGCHHVVYLGRPTRGGRDKARRNVGTKVPSPMFPDLTWRWGYSRTTSDTA